ncbi:MAG: lysophospholipid acyltransferase family protein [Cytophagales bacterium]
MKFLLRIFTIWVALWFFCTFLALYPLFFISVQHPKLNWLGHLCYRIWGAVVFIFSGVPLLVKREFKQEKGKVYVFVANHGSYLDIPVMYLLTRGNVSFLGKSSLGKVPLFGYLYKRLHILVDRKTRDSKIEAVEKCREKLDNGFSIIIFAEGTIPKDAPVLNDFKDGAFKLAIEKQIPVIPITIPYNWLILPDDKSFTVHWHMCKATIHKPISTEGLVENDTVTLRQNVKNIIEQELISYLGDDYRQRKSKKDSTSGSSRI